MHKSFRYIAFLVFSLMLFSKNSNAQSVSITTYDPGPYTKGSSIAVRISITQGASCLTKNNIFTLYLVDALNNLIQIGTNNGFGGFNGSYATYINGTIPANTAAGSYRLVVKTSSPGSTGPVTTVPISVIAGTAITAGTYTPNDPLVSSSPENVFGKCVVDRNNAANSYYFVDASTPAANVVSSGADLYNESDGNQEGGTGPQNGGTGLPSYLPTTNATNYTVFVKAVGTVGVATKAYTLLNNPLLTNFGASAQGPVCLTTSNGLPSATANFFTNISTPTGLQNNYPGYLYTINWGDGTSATYTYCDIANANGNFTHPYSQSSCNKPGNAYSISFSLSSPFCTGIVQPLTASQPILAPPTNSLTGPNILCSGNTGRFVNTSYAGQSVGGGTNCIDNTATYSWIVQKLINGVFITQQTVLNQTATSTLNYTFSSAGNYRVIIRYTKQNTISCTPQDAHIDVCVQDPPTAAFNLPTAVCSTSNVTVTNTATPDISCNATYTYKYTISPSTGFSLVAPSQLTDPSPVLKFNPGVYTVTQQITPPAGLATCPSAPLTKTIYVDGSPTATLKGNLPVCGINQTLTFDNAVNSPTQVVYSGNYSSSVTYQWSVTPVGNITPATFVNSTTSADKYPQINFPDAGSYDVSVTTTNLCGTSTVATQRITLVNGPTFSANILPNVVCPDGSTVALHATVSNSGSLTGSPTWISSGQGTFISGQGTLDAVYKPGGTDLSTSANQNITISLQQGSTTCGMVNSNLLSLTIYANDVVTSGATKSICNSSAVNYTIIPSVNGSNLTWTAVGSSANVTGFNDNTTPSANALINDVLVNNGTSPETVTYTIIPHTANCDGSPFTFTVTVNPTPILTATPPTATICSGVATGINLTSNLGANTKYTWTITYSNLALNAITGASEQTTPLATAQINQSLVNNTTAPIDVTYRITPQNNGCVGSDVLATRTVQPKLIPVITAPTGVCSGSTTGITLNSNLPAGTTTYTWVATLQSGTATGFTNGSTTGNTIPDILVNTSATPAVVHYIITPSANGCDGTPVPKDIIVTAVPTVSAPPTATTCSNTGTGIALTSNIGSSAKYTWTVAISDPASGAISGATHPITPVATTLINDVLINNTSAPINVTYTITAHNGDCDGPIQATTTVTVEPQVVASAHPSLAICSGSTTDIILTSTSGSGTTYTWTATPSTAATTLSGYSPMNNPTNNNQILQTLINTGTTVQTVIYKITPHFNNCDGQPLTFTISIAPIPTLSATPSATNICSGTSSVITLSSNIGLDARYNWTAMASSPNITGFSGQAVGAYTTQIQQTLTNTGTTPGTVTYSISVVNGATSANCATSIPPVTITVQPPTVAANAGPDENVCGVTSYQLKGNNLGPNAIGMWTVTSGQTGVTFTDASVYNTIANNLIPGQSYTFRWTSKGSLPCSDSFDDVVINDQVAVIKAAFTTDRTVGCGTTLVNFANTSTNVAGLTYAWDFGNGVTSNLKNPAAVSYIAQANGRDSVYTVTLRITNTCSTDVTTQTIIVKPLKPIVAINPDKTLTCAPFTLNVQNLSPGTNQTYTFFLTDANGTLITKNIKTDKSDQQFQITNPGTYKVYMIAQSECGTAQTTTYTIVGTPNTAFPRLTIDGNAGTGCAPLTVTFHNNSTGTTAYRYDWGDGTTSLVTNNTNDVTHTFIKGGTYSVVLHASNGCTLDITAAPIVINVLYQPTIGFTPDVTTGCKALKVHFTNTTTDPSTSQLSDLKYEWDFGDGSAHSHEINPTHTYSFKNSPFIVTLTATNATGCTNILSKENLITVNSSPITQFVAKPDSVISIPNYHFSFLDQSKGNPISWRWTFGDGTASASQNPEHTYADTGLYKVTLTAANVFCDSTISHYVRITGVPGQVYLPNAFMPNSVDPELKTFSLKGSGLKTWHLQIFNNYGQLLWETTKLSEKGVPLESWDGTFNGMPLPQGVYVWQASGTFINGTEWKGMSYNGSAPKHTGVIHLLR